MDQVYTPRYAPPEFVNENTRYKTSDVWSLGAIAMHLLAGQRIWNGLTENEDINF